MKLQSTNKLPVSIQAFRLLSASITPQLAAFFLGSPTNKGDQKMFVLTMISDKYGTETFEYDNRSLAELARAGIESRVAAHPDGVVRYFNIADVSNHELARLRYESTTHRSYSNEGGN